MAAIMGAGDMDVRVKFYKNNPVVDEFGASSLETALYLSTYCHVKYIGTPSAGASEEFINDQKTGKVKVEITTRFASGIDFDDIFELEEATFNVYSIHIIGRRQALVIRGESRDDQSDVPGRRSKTLLAPGQPSVWFDDMHFPAAEEMVGDELVEMLLLESQEQYFDELKPPVISAVKMYVDDQFQQNLVLTGTEYTHGGSVIGYRIIPLPPEEPADPPVDPPEEIPPSVPTLYYSNPIVGAEKNTLVCTVKVWDGYEYKSYEYRQDVTVQAFIRASLFEETVLGEGEEAQSFMLNDDGANWRIFYSNSAAEVGKMRIMKGQPWKFWLQDPLVYTNKKGGLKYRMQRTTSRIRSYNGSGAENIYDVNWTAAGVHVNSNASQQAPHYGWFDYLYIPNPPYPTGIPNGDVRLDFVFVDIYIGDDLESVKFGWPTLEMGVVSFKFTADIIRPPL
jgi:hypothetical protein